MIDEHGYPTKKALKKIKKWPNDDMPGLMEFVKGLWSYPHYWEENEDSGNKTIRYSISTGGWSGNEDLIYAMKRNIMFWAFCWYSSRRGGHYVFVVSAKELDNE